MPKQKSPLSVPTVSQTSSHLPQSSSAPGITILNLLATVCNLIDLLLMSLAYILLIFQTLYILSSKQPKYINLRHIALKWLFCLFLYQLKQGFGSSNTFNSSLMIILLDLAIIAMAYPSKMLKAVHLKYFSYKQQQRYNEGVVDPNKYDLNFTEKIIISLVVLVLNACKHFIALTMPQNRKPIEEVLREINGVVIDKKCFWSIYQVENKDGAEAEKQKNASKQFLMSGSMINTDKNLSLNLSPSSKFLPFQPGPYSSREKTQYIKSYGQLCRVRSNGLKALKKILVKYNISTSQLEVHDIDSTKFQIYLLQEVTERPDNILQFIATPFNHKQSSAIYVKFKTLREMQVFIRAIQEGEKRIQQMQ